MSKTVLLFLLFCVLTKAEQDYNATCSDSSQSGLTFEATSDGVPGRYRIEWCTTADRNVTNWELVMRYKDNRAASFCEKYDYRIPPGAVHSRFNKEVHLDLNCTNVCFSTNLDLIFNGTCYSIKTWLQRGTRSSSPRNFVHYILNPYPKKHFTDSKAYASTFSTDEELVVYWYLDFPASDYTMELCTDDIKVCVNITGNCTTIDPCQCKVRCALAAPFGNYTVTLRHQAPWTSSELFQPHLNVYHKVDHSRPAALPAVASRAALWWVCGVAGVAAVVALLLIRAYRARLAAALRLKVLREWLDRTETEPVMKPANNNEVEEEQRILLLYARDCAQFARVAEILRKLLTEGTGCKVIDLYSAETVRESARAPGEWLQRLLSAPNVRVVLLQSPAAALHAPAPVDNQQQLVAPLHGRRVVPAAPHPSDWLLSLALRRLAETGHVGLPYRKYFVAEIAGLEADVLPYLTRLRRYSLPAAAHTLIQDLTPDTHNTHNTNGVNHTQDNKTTPILIRDLTPDTRHTHNTHDTNDINTQDNKTDTHYADMLRQLTEAVDELTGYMRDNPDYIADILQVC